MPRKAWTTLAVRLFAPVCPRRNQLVVLGGTRCRGSGEGSAVPLDSRPGASLFLFGLDAVNIWDINISGTSTSGVGGERSAGGWGELRDPWGERGYGGMRRVGGSSSPIVRWTSSVGHVT
ncbi:MAG: hypothetical protein NW237_03590 [Cyanobacteriota bacterium]|nr:hypothetical protein [Cyanobacteriota bacterium]